MTRREWIAMLAATPLLKASPDAPTAPVSIARCSSYDEDVTAKMAALFDQLGGLENLVRNKTVTVKINMTGPTAQRVQGKALGITHYTHPKVVGATAYLLSKAGARRVRFVESAWATAGPLEEVMPENGILRCPWHGYRFDLRTGASADGRGCRLAPAPRVFVDPVTGEVSLRY